ncbi:MAG: tetratricopeptide repeat protein [Prevotellaceae bacterium]|jgi:tetratricopeptide (TPR) repeat protein|nr:tetratricopeptide repeat protein [Prevotellaceae bacterium]
MQKILLSILIAVLSLQVAAQDCSQDENFVRFMTRGRLAVKTAEKPEDYKLAAGEFKKALEYDAKCADIYVQLAVCYEQMGELDPGNYRQAINYLNTYLSLRPDALNKQEIQEKVYELEFLLEKAGGMSLDNLIGKWKFYWGNGDDKSLFDIEIYKNQGNYYTKYVIEEGWIADKNGSWSNNKPDYQHYETCGINYKDGIITFWTLHNRSNILYDNREYSHSKNEFHYELHLEENILRGICKCSLRFHGKGHRDYSSVFSAQKAGKATIWDDCEGDCGNYNVYFVKR